MRALIVFLVFVATLAQDFHANPKRSSSGLEFDDSRELLSYMHIKQHKMEDHYVKQVATFYIFYNKTPKDGDTKAIVIITLIKI